MLLAEREASALPSCPECRDSWEWVANYDDGTTLFECAGNGSPHHGFADIEQSRLESLAWLPRRHGLAQIVVKLDPGLVRPILFRRRQIELEVGGGTGGHQTIHCLGWQKRLESGDCVQSFTFAFEDGSVLVTDDRNAV